MNETTIENGTKEALLARIRMSRDLPTVPAVAIRIIRISRDLDADLGELASLVSADTMLTAKVLRLANSTIFAARSEITTVRRALVRLGLRVTRITALGFSLMDGAKRLARPRFDIDHFWRHALTTASAARVICQAVGSRRLDEAFAAGLLQDVGVLAMGFVLPEEYAEVIAEQKARQWEDLCSIEARNLGVTHMDVGSDLLRHWEIPAEVHEPILYHHRPGEAKEAGLSAEIVDMARILWLGATIAELFCDPGKWITHEFVVKEAQERFDLSESAAADVLQRVDTGVREMADLFSVDPRPCRPTKKSWPRPTRNSRNWRWRARRIARVVSR